MNYYIQTVYFVYFNNNMRCWVGKNFNFASWSKLVLNNIK